MITLPITAQEAVKRLTNALPSRRMRDVLERRFALKGPHKATLEEIGTSYKITRERVRQIEADALRRVAEGRELSEIGPVFLAVGERLSAMGGVASAHDLFSALADAKAHPHLHFILQFHPGFIHFTETEESHPRWAAHADKAGLVEKMVAGTIRSLEERGRPVSKKELMDTARASAGNVFHAVPEDAVLDTYLATSKLIQKNPYGEYGLALWPSISPRGIKDKAHTAITHAKRPAHFREVAALIDAGGWTKKKVHPQTVHNELIKDKRFVLVGRGMYALREWGYEEGSVREVIAGLMKNSKAPMTRDEIIALASEKRMVKPQTILLNLQNQDMFKKTADGKYTLV